MKNHKNNRLPTSETVVENSDLTAPLLIDVNTLAKMLDISPRTVWRLVSSGRMLSPIRIGGAVRWRYQEVYRWIEQGCPQPPPLYRHG